MMFGKTFLSACLLLGLTAVGSAQTITNLGNVPSANPYVTSGLIYNNGVAFGVAASYYGNTSTPFGDVFYVKSGSTTPVTVYSFTGGANGSYPLGPLTADSSGNLFGAAVTGGNNTLSECKSGGITGCGLIFELKKGTGLTYTYSVIYKFTGNTDGLGPVGGFVIDSSGNIYGETQYGGCTATLTYGMGCGTVWKLTKGTSSYTESVLYKFTGGTNGAYPFGGLVVDTSGNLYGTTLNGGTSETACSTQVNTLTVPSQTSDGKCGTVFKLTKSGSTYTQSILHSFTDTPDGSFPYGGLVIDASNNLYGSAFEGGTETLACTQGNGYTGCGTVYKIAAGTTTFTVLYTFSGLAGDAAENPGPLVYDSNGAVFGVNQYNTTNLTCASAFYCGDVFKVTTGGVASVVATLNGTTNIGAFGGLGVDTSHNFYGVTYYNTNTGYEITSTPW